MILDCINVQVLSAGIQIRTFIWLSTQKYTAFPHASKASFFFFFLSWSQQIFHQPFQKKKQNTSFSHSLFTRLYYAFMDAIDKTQSQHFSLNRSLMLHVGAMDREHSC